MYGHSGWHGMASIRFESRECVRWRWLCRVWSAGDREVPGQRAMGIGGNRAGAPRRRRRRRLRGVCGRGSGRCLRPRPAGGTAHTVDEMAGVLGVVTLSERRQTASLAWRRQPRRVASCRLERSRVEERSRQEREWEHSPTGGGPWSRASCVSCAVPVAPLSLPRVVWGIGCGEPAFSPRPSGCERRACVNGMSTRASRWSDGQTRSRGACAKL